MTLATVLPNMRAAFRERLLTVVDVDVSVAVTAAAGALTRASGSWIADGLAIGQEVTVEGVGATAVALVTGVTDTRLSTNGPFSGSGTARVRARLPGEIAWEGRKYAPTTRPFVAERVQSASTRRTAMGPSGTIEHRILGHANLFYPSQNLTLAIERMAGAVMTTFRPGTSLSYGGDAGRVQQVEQSGLMLDGEWLSLAVTVTILAFTSD